MTLSIQTHVGKFYSLLSFKREYSCEILFPKHAYADRMDICTLRSRLLFIVDYCPSPTRPEVCCNPEHFVALNKVKKYKSMLV